MTFDEYAEKYLSALTPEAVRLVQMGWNAHEEFGTEVRELKQDRARLLKSLSDADDEIERLRGEAPGQAARAQGGESVGSLHSSQVRALRRNVSRNCGSQMTALLDQLIANHPQPAQQGVPGVCDGKEQEAFEVYASRKGYDMAQHPMHYLFINDKTNAARHAWKAAISYCHEQVATPQPAGDGWIKCSERLPKLGERVQLFSQGVIQHMMPLLVEDDEGLLWDFEMHDYNPPVDVGRDQWRPIPQPPKEGEGDE